MTVIYNINYQGSFYNVKAHKLQVVRDWDI